MNEQPTILFLLEELSAENMLKVIVPKMIDTSKIKIHYRHFQGKTDLQKNITQKIKHWQTPNTYFIVMQDLDNHPNCKQLKQELLDKCALSGKHNYYIRLACHELESFYLGDFNAIELAYNINLNRYKNKTRYQQPDGINTPSKELAKITNHQYQKTSGSTLIAKYMNIETNQSSSFKVLIEVIKKINKEYLNYE